jgi:predicted anti-sigma-YlaC factor YlaD
MNCSVFRELLEPYLDDSLGEERRDWFRSHLRGCRSCRSWALGEEPSLLFATAARPARDEATVEECVQSVARQIRQQRLQRRIQGSRRPWLAAAAAVVLAVGGGVVWRLSPGDHRNAIGGDAASASTPGETTAPPSIEVEMTGEDVRVYQFATEDGDTAVYYVVNPAMEL